MSEPRIWDSDPYESECDFWLVKGEGSPRTLVGKVELVEHLNALEANLAALRGAGEALYTLVDFVKSNITLDDSGAEHWFDDRDAALAAWSAAISQAEAAT